MWQEKYFLIENTNKKGMENYPGHDDRKGFSKIQVNSSFNGFCCNFRNLTSNDHQEDNSHYSLFFNNSSFPFQRKIYLCGMFDTRVKGMKNNTMKIVPTKKVRQ